MQTRHAFFGVMVSPKHNVGILVRLKARALQAVSSVVPSGTVTDSPSMVRVTDLLMETVVVLRLLRL